MGVVQNLAQVTERIKKADSASSSGRSDVNWLSLDDGESVKVIFLQELDEGSPSYSEKNGKGLFSLQHTHPEDFKRNAACTDDEGECFGCKSGWRQKIVLYLNALVVEGKNEGEVVVFSKGVGKNSAGRQLVDIASDADFDNSISDKVFKITRTGTKTDTTYSMNPLKAHDKNLEEYDLFELDGLPFYVSPERQEHYYTGGGGEDKPKPVPEKAASYEAEW